MATCRRLNVMFLYRYFYSEIFFQNLSLLERVCSHNSPLKLTNELFSCYLVPMCQNEASIVQTLSAQNWFNKHENEHEGGTYFYMNRFELGRRMGSLSGLFVLSRTIKCGAGI